MKEGKVLFKPTRRVDLKAGEKKYRKQTENIGMHSIFEPLFETYPQSITDGVYFYNTDSDGDHFNDSDVGAWRDNRFDDSWGKQDFLQNGASRYLLDRIVARQAPIIDLACGPGMGLIPSVKQLSPSHVCLATDASSLLISEWKKYVDQYRKEADLSFAQFSLMDIPFGTNSVPAYSGYLCIGSTRSGLAGQMRALTEIYRTLMPGGCVYLIENQWSPVERILDVFEKMNRAPWDIFLSSEKTWEDKFRDAGFQIEFENKFRSYKVGADDNELGAAAEKYGFEITITDKVYILRK